MSAVWLFFLGIGAGAAMVWLFAWIATIVAARTASGNPRREGRTVDSIRAELEREYRKGKRARHRLTSRHQHTGSGGHRANG